MGSYEPFPVMTMASEPATKQDRLVSTIRPLISNFLETIDYDAPSKPDKAALRAAMTQYAARSGVPYHEDKHSRQCFETGLSVAIVSPGILTLHPTQLDMQPYRAALCSHGVSRAKRDLSAYALFFFFSNQDMYPSHPLDVQLHIGIFTWLGFLIDDTNKRIASDLAHFQARFYTGQPQPSLLLDHFAQNLRNTYQYYDPVIANTIVLSALAFVNSNALETRREFQELVPSQAAASWPYYFRDKEGLPDTYTGFIFPKTLYPDIGSFLQAIPDMGRFINLTNDILS